MLRWLWGEAWCSLAISVDRMLLLATCAFLRCAWSFGIVAVAFAICPCLPIFLVILAEFGQGVVICLCWVWRCLTDSQCGDVMFFCLSSLCKVLSSLCWSYIYIYTLILITNTPYLTLDISWYFISEAEPSLFLIFLDKTSVLVERTQAWKWVSSEYSSRVLVIKPLQRLYPSQTKESSARIPRNSLYRD